MMTKTLLGAKPPIAAKLSPAHSLARELAGAWLFSEGAGGIACDASGHSHGGTFSGGPLWVPGRFGVEVAFDGIDDWITMGDCLDLGLDDVTLMAIVKYDAANQPDEWSGYRIGAIAGKGQLDDAGAGYGLHVYTDNTVSWEVNNQGQCCDVWSDSALNDGQHHIVIGVCDRSNTTGVRLYVDGIPQAQTADPTAFDGVVLNGTKAFAIGSAQSEAGSWFWDYQGSVAAVCVWKRALTDGEIRDLQVNPFAPFACRRSIFPTGVSARIVELSGSITAQTTSVASLSVIRSLNGSAVAATSCQGSVQVIRQLSGVAAANTHLSGSLTHVRYVDVSGITGGTSSLTGMLRTVLPEPLFQGMLQTEPMWRREALFNGMTATAFKLGTALTQGWFWVRRSGCCGIHHGPTPAEVDFANVLTVTDADVTQVLLPAYIPHDAGSTRCYILRRFNNCGQQERTLSTAVLVRIDANGQLAPATPNAAFGVTSGHIGGALQLLWFYCPLDQAAGPQDCRLYWDNGTGRIDLDNPIAVVPYQGRRLYVCDIAPTPDGRYKLAVAASDAAGQRGPLQSGPTCEIQTRQPPGVQIIAAGAI